MTSITRGFGTDPVRAHRPPAPALHSSPATRHEHSSPHVSPPVRPAAQAAHDSFSLARDPVTAIQSP